MIHDQMAPVRDGDWGARSPDRSTYCEGVVQKANTYRRQLIYDQSWRALFNEEGKSVVRAYLEDSRHIRFLRQAFESLLNKLRKFAKDNEEKKLPFVVAFDEASTLFQSGHSGELQAGRYIALNRIF